jgi:chemotaxis regulatin CheY-phosphate phosphatase CheZ
MKSLNLNMTSVEVKAEARALRASWSSEMAQELNSYHALSLEKEIEKIYRVENRKKSIKNIFKS